MAKRQRRAKGKGRVSARRRAEERSSGSGSNYLRLPEGVEFFQVENEGPYKLNFYAWEVGEGNPYADPGELHFEMTFFVHRNVGPNRRMVVCPARTRNKPCPICEDRERLDASGEAEDEEIKALLPKERQAWLLGEDGSEDLKLWDYSYHLFGKQLDGRVKDSDEEDEYEFFASWEGGKTLRVGFEKDSFGGGNPFYRARSIDFRDREDVPAEILEKLFAVEDCLVVLPYDELKELYYQTGSEDEEPEKERRPRSGGRAKKDEDEKPKRGRSSGNGKGRKPKEEEPEPAAEEDDWDEQPEKEAAPAAGESGGGGDSDDDWDDDW